MLPKCLLLLSLLSTLPQPISPHVIRHKDIISAINGTPKSKARKLAKSAGIVGVLTLPVSKLLRNKIYMNIYESHSEFKMISELNELERMSFFPASYAKWLRKHSIQVVPIDIYSSEHELRYLMKSVDGILLTGGAVPLLHAETKIRIDDGFSGIGHIKELGFYTRKIREVVRIAKEINDKQKKSYPIWATCLGFEGLILAQAGLDVRFSDIDNNNFNSKLDLWPDTEDSPLIRHFKKSELADFQSKNIFFFNHDHAFFVDEFSRNEELMNEYRIVATAQPKHQKYNKPIVAIIENRKYPFYGVQFHPEKNQFESKVNVDRTRPTLKLMSKFAGFFCNKLEKTDNEEKMSRIQQRLQGYSVYVGSNIGVFDEVYIFQKDN